MMQDVQASAEEDPAIVGSRETGSHAIIESEEGGPSPEDCLTEAPQPQRPQDAQENDDQDEDLYSADPQESHEPPAEDLSDDVRKEFCQKLSQLLESKMVEKDQKVNSRLSLHSKLSLHLTTCHALCVVCRVQNGTHRRQRDTR